MVEFKPVIVPEDMVPALYAEIASLQTEVARLRSPTPQAVEALRGAVIEECIAALKAASVVHKERIAPGVLTVQIEAIRALSTPSPTDRLEEKPARHDEGPTDLTEAIRIVKAAGYAVLPKEPSPARLKIISKDFCADPCDWAAHYRAAIQEIEGESP